MSVWGDGNSFGSDNDKPGDKDGKKLSSGAFGSPTGWSDSGSPSIPFMSSNSHTSYSNRYELQSGHSSLIFGEGQNQNGLKSSSFRTCSWNTSASNQSNWNMSSSGGSSRNSSGPGSIDMSGTGEGVFREEICRIAEGNTRFHDNSKF